MTRPQPILHTGLAVRPVDTLIPYARNSRTHTAAQVAQIAASIREFGWTNPVLVDEDGGIIAGHARVLAAQKLGMPEVPCLTLAGLTPAQRQAYVIADNRLALNAGWDEEMLRLELQDLTGAGFDLNLLAFTEEELATLLAPPPEAGLTDADAVIPLEERVVTVLGDVWLLGRHRLVCGDSTQADTVAACLAGVTPHLMVTDPPYGVNYDASWREEEGLTGAGSAKGKVLNDDRADWREAWALFPGDVAYVWFASNMAPAVGASLEVCGFTLRSLVIWAKSRFPISRGNYHWQHEPCWYAVRKGKPGHWQGDRRQSTLWQIQGEPNTTGHSTQKPVECMRRPIENNSSPGQAVYEPFSGSGTTIIAGEQTGRQVLAIELNPAYVDATIRRWQAFTGGTATREADGLTFEQAAGQAPAEPAA